MGTELAIELAQNQSCGVMMMVKNDVYEQVSFKVEEYGVLTLPRPCTAQQAFQTMKLLVATQQRLKALEQKTASLEEKMKEIGVGKIAMISGRYYAMDRDNRWDRVELAYNAMVKGEGVTAACGVCAVQQSYDVDKTDEFVIPTVVVKDGAPLATMLKV